jgi:dynein heavy chain
MFSSECISSPTDMARLWVHETSRVYRDKLADLKDIETFDKAHKDIFKKTFDDIPEVEVMINPLIFCHFAKGIGEPKYMPIPKWDNLN